MVKICFEPRSIDASLREAESLFAHPRDIRDLFAILRDSRSLYARSKDSEPSALPREAHSIFVRLRKAWSVSACLSVARQEDPD